jgi:hypothetical protein
MTEKDDLETVHRESSRNRVAVENSQLCGCFYCLLVFEPTSITKWIDLGITAMCPRCGIDSVLPSSKNPIWIDPSFLKAMHERWFGESYESFPEPSETES